MHNTYVGTQPIYNKDLVIYAHQLLFRNSDENKASFKNSDQATSEVILNTLTDIGLDKLVGSGKALINFTQKFVVGEYPIPGIKRRIVVELQENIEPDDAIVTGLNQLADKGFTLAMNESLYSKYFNTPSDHEYIIKFDTKSNEPAKVKEHIEQYRADNVKFLAEKVETQDDFIFYSDLGFDYFQGFFFCRPNIVKTKGIPSTKIQVVQLLQKLQDEDTDSKKIDALISTDVSLTYRLLRYANSSHLGLSTRIDSIQHAVTLLGWTTVKMIATLLVLSSIDDKPFELFYFGLLRAKLCEILAGYKQGIDKNMAFTAGLLSVVDALMDADMEEILAQLPLSNTLTQALLNHEGSLGGILSDAIAYIEHRPEEAVNTELSASALREAYLKALMWTTATAPALKP
ncbi:MAG: HDOD domain-containing protein [Gammaproteobacteria bacterium]|nr:HDOD domain-containing protein [Gammaproteobacteria bacterium]MDH5777409.1 HDOD domain-containing protein [Gammaproteobacteria bacterium]